MDASPRHQTLTSRPITRFARLVFLAFMLSCSRAPQQSLLTLSIVGTNDLHGGVLEVDGRGGLALFDGYLRNLRAARARDHGAVVLLDAGDLFQGTLESNLNEGAVVIAAYNALHYDAATIGNHEFDFGPVGPATAPESPADDPLGALKARASEARFPFFAANIIDKTTGHPLTRADVKPSTILTIAGIRIGVVGLATMETLESTLTANTRALDVIALAPALEREATRLRREGATVVIGLAHAGGRCTKFDDPTDLSSCAADAEIFNVARAVPAGLVDLIVAGHRHEGLAHEVAGVPIISAYSSGRAFGRVDLTVDRGTGQVVNHRLFPPHDICEQEDPASGKCVASGGVAAQYEGAAIQKSAEIETALLPGIEAAAELKRKPLNATIEETLPDTDGESALSNLLADWTRAAAGVDIAIANTGGVRAALPAGPLTYGRLFELTPFDNREARLTLTGAELGPVVRGNLQRRGDLIVLSGARAVATCGVGGLHISLRREAGRPIRDTDRLTIVTSDFLATGGSEFFTAVMPFRSPANIAGPIVRDKIADWLARRGGNWRGSDRFSPANRRVAYEGRRPVHCNQ